MNDKERLDALSAEVLVVLRAAQNHLAQVSSEEYQASLARNDIQRMINFKIDPKWSDHEAIVAFISEANHNLSSARYHLDRMTTIPAAMKARSAVHRVLAFVHQCAEEVVTSR